MPATVRSAVRRVAAVFALTLTTVLLTAGLSPAQATPAATNEGWIRPAHHTPDTPKEDDYLASFRCLPFNAPKKIVLRLLLGRGLESMDTSALRVH